MCGCMQIIYTDTYMYIYIYIYFFTAVGHALDVVVTVRNKAAATM